MIKLAASTAFMLYLAVTLAVLLGIWAWTHIKSWKDRKHITSSHGFIYDYSEHPAEMQVNGHMTLMGETAKIHDLSDLTQLQVNGTLTLVMQTLHQSMPVSLPEIKRLNLQIERDVDGENKS